MKTLPYLFKKPFKTLSLFLFFLPFLVSCNKEKLTKPTQTGANTFSCKVNGQVYIPRNEAFSVDGISIYFTNDIGNPQANNLHVLTAYPQFNPPRKIYITLYNLTVEGVYPLKGTNFRFCQYLTLSPNEKEYNTKSADDGQVTITKFDLTNRIVSGTFWFNAINLKDPNDKVSITDGRFDLKF